MSRKDYSRYTDYENYTMLSDRELEVLKMKNSGDSNGKIAEKIGIKYNTVSIKKSIVKKELYASSNRRAEKIIAERSLGKTVREIAKEQGCTIQNIYEILSTYRKRIKNNPGE